MENLKNVAPIEDFNWDAYETGESVASASHEELEKAYDNTLNKVCLLYTSPNILNKFRHTYNSFAPRVRLTWTPGQYYYMTGDRKVNLHSKYPSISVDWERCV